MKGGKGEWRNAYPNCIYPVWGGGREKEKNDETPSFSTTKREKGKRRGEKEVTLRERK